MPQSMRQCHTILHVRMANLLNGQYLKDRRKHMPEKLHFLKAFGNLVQVDKQLLHIHRKQYLTLVHKIPLFEALLHFLKNKELKIQVVLLQFPQLLQFPKYTILMI